MLCAAAAAMCNAAEWSGEVVAVWVVVNGLLRKERG